MGGCMSRRMGKNDSDDDDALQARTGPVMNALADGNLSLHCLDEVTSSFLDMEQNVAKLMLENKIDIWNSPDLFQLVQEYFDNSLKTSNFYSQLGNCLKRAREKQISIQTALQHVTPEALQENSEAQYRKIQEELQNFKTAGCPLPDEFFGRFQAVYKGHVEMLEKLHAKRSKLHKKLKNVRAWRIFSGIIFVATFATVLICSVVAAAIAAPPVAAACAAATSIPIGSVGKWVDSLWTKYEDTIKEEREVINAMEAGTFVALRVPVERLESSMSSILSVEWCLKDKNAVEDMRRKQQSFSDEIDDLIEYVHRCSLDIEQARTWVVLKIIRPA